MLKFNTTGPCFPYEHYMLPALDRLPGIRELVTTSSSPAKPSTSSDRDNSSSLIAVVPYL